MKAWEIFLSEQEKELGEATVKKWLRSLRLVRFDAQNLYLEAKDSFQALWFEEHIRKKLDKSFVNNNFRKIKVHLSIGNPLEATPLPPRKKGEEKKPLPFTLNFDTLNPNYTFDQFYPSENNKVNLQILLGEKSFNPIYLCGPSGTGKTHLLMAFAAQEAKKGKQVSYVRTETFTQHVVSAIRASQMPYFRAAYRNIDVLILDNVEELAHKGATQEELFHTFNTLHLAGKQILLASSKTPGELQFIEPRLVSRFEWGIVLPLEKPSAQERLPILERHCQALSFPLHSKVKQFLIETFQSNTKALIQALEALILRTHVHHEAKGIPSTSLTLPLIKHTLTDLIEQEQAIKLSTEKIIHAVAEHYQINPHDLLGNSQAREICFPRQVAMFLCRQELKLPYKKIGDLFTRDHSTVMSSVRLIAAHPDTPTLQYDILKKIT